MSRKTILMSAGVLGMTTVILGAFGAHALREVLSPGSLESYTTGVRYQAWHSLALLALSFSPERFPGRRSIYRCWLGGILLFSGSIYGLALDELMGWDWGFLGLVTPLGGILFIIGWFLVFKAGWQGSEPAPGD